MIRIFFQKVAHNISDTSAYVQKVCPLPQKIQPGKGSIILDENVKILIEGFEELLYSIPKISPKLEHEYLLDPKWDIKIFAEKMRTLLNERIKELGHPLEFANKDVQVRDEGKNPTTHEKLRSDAEAKIPPGHRRQSYILSAEEKGIEIIAWTMRGAYYGIVTLLSMMNVEKKHTNLLLLVPAMSIIDWPQFEIRGLVDDISRGQRPTLDNFKFFIRYLSFTKQNILVLYIEDIFHWESHPDIGKGRGPLTKADIKELEAYAKEWFVNIVPGVEMLGHMDNILTDPQYREYAEFPGAQCLNIANPKTKQFVDELLAEIVPVFESPIFAPICDESFDFCLYASKSLAQQKGMARAYADWYLFLIEEIQKYGKEAVLFAHDIIIKFPDALNAIVDKNTLIYYWKYTDQKKYPEISKLIEKGFSVIGGPAVFDWSRHYPYYDFGEVNMIEMGKDGAERGLVGLVTTKWGDFFNENFRDNIFYGLAVNGQASWSPTVSNVDQIRAAYAWHFFGMTDLTIIECMDTLSKQNIPLPSFPNGMFNRFWLDPFVREIKSKEYEMAERFIKEAIEILAKIDMVKTKHLVKKNQGNLDYLTYSAKMARHYGAKILLSEAVYRDNKKLAEKAYSLLKYPENNTLSGFKWLKTDCEALAKEYEGLWLRLAVKEGLEYPMEHFKVLNWHYTEAIKKLEQNQKPHAHQLKSHWIWRTGKRTSPMWGNQTWYYFFKSFTPKAPIKRAIVQGIAGNHLLINLNGKFIGEVLSRFSLSQFPIAKAVHWFDVTNEIKADTLNLLCIDGVNWAGGIGAINIILHLEYDDGKSEDIITDETWIYSDQKPEGWPFASIEDKKELGWTPVRDYGAPPGAWYGPITSPVWEQNQKSSVSFAFANRNFIDTAIPAQIGEGIYKPLFWLIPAGGKLLKTDIFDFRLELPDGTTKIVPQ
jgi:hypothetical protein